MADNVTLNSMSGGDVVRTVDRAGIETQVVIIDKSGGATANVGLTGSKTVSTAAPTTTATLILAANTGRKGCILQNRGTVGVFLGPSSGVTTSAYGHYLAPGDVISDDISTDAWYGITSSGTGDIRVIEVA